MKKVNFNDYTIVSNTCLGGFIYKDLNRKYDNPFMWNMWNDEIIVDLIEHYDEVVFNNFKVNKTFSNELTGRVSKVFNAVDRDIFSIIIDDKYEIYYPHYIEDKEAEVTLKGQGKLGVDIHCNNVEEYLSDIYKKRVERMRGLKPLFVLDVIRDNEIIKRLMLIKNKPIIIGNTLITFNTKDKSIIKYNSEVAWEKSKEVIEKFNI